MGLTNIIHPEIFSFDLEQKAGELYQEAYNLSFEEGHRHAFAAPPKTAELRTTVVLND
jgi:hypothetical protein